MLQEPAKQQQNGGAPVSVNSSSNSKMGQLLNKQQQQQAAAFTAPSPGIEEEATEEATEDDVAIELPPPMADIQTQPAAAEDQRLVSDVIILRRKYKRGVLFFLHLSNSSREI